MTTQTFATATIADLDLAREACAYFLEDRDVKFTATTGGVNNVVQYVETSSGKKYILRIYNNGLNHARVAFEHEILAQLAPMNLSFLVPRCLPSLDDANESYVKLSNGADACFFDLIPGVLPKVTLTEEIGAACGELSIAMAKVQVSQPAPTAPYYELYKVHHAVTREKFYELVRTPAFDGCREATTLLVKEIEEIEARAAAYNTQSKLPKQLIHGDLHYDNVLVDGGKVSGLLDFEFCALDWRAMELAVCLSKYAGEKDPMPYFKSFVDGFSKHGRLTPAEVAAIPDLINLRILSNVVYFVGRAIANEDSIDSLTTRAKTYADRVMWIKKNSQAIQDMVGAKMKSDAAASLA